MCYISSRSIFCLELAISSERRTPELEGSGPSLTCKLEINLFNKQGGFSLKEGREEERREGGRKRRRWKKQAGLGL